MADWSALPAGAGDAAPGDRNTDDGLPPCEAQWKPVLQSICSMHQLVVQVPALAVGLAACAHWVQQATPPRVPHVLFVHATHGLACGAAGCGGICDVTGGTVAAGGAVTLAHDGHVVLRVIATPPHLCTHGTPLHGTAMLCCPPCRWQRPWPLLLSTYSMHAGFAQRPMVASTARFTPLTQSPQVNTPAIVVLVPAWHAAQGPSGAAAADPIPFHGVPRVE